jgi:hypothetical protein
MVRNLIAAMLLGGLLMLPHATAQAPAEQQRQTAPTPPAPPQTPQPPAGSTARLSDPDPNLTPPSELERAIEDLVEGHIEGALGERRRGRQSSPEMDRAIANAIESPEGREVMRAIAEKIRSGDTPGRREFLLALLILISGIALMGLVAALLYWRSQARTRARLEFQTQLLSKFGSGQELAAFLNSGGSQRLMEELSAEPLTSKQRILKRARGGTLFTAFGLVFLMASPWLDDGWGFIGVGCMALGFALLASAVMTYRLSEKMGLLREEPARPTQPPVPPPDHSPDQGAAS